MCTIYLIYIIILNKMDMSTDLKDVQDTNVWEVAENSPVLFPTDWPVVFPGSLAGMGYGVGYGTGAGLGISLG